MTEHTKVKWELIPGSTCIQDDRQRNIAYVNYVDMPTDEEIGREEAIAHAEHIILAANQHHALVEALEKFAKLENATQYFDELVYNDWVPLSLDAKNLANQIGREATEALLATHTQEEAPDSPYGKDSQPRPINTNEATE